MPYYNLYFQLVWFNPLDVKILGVVLDNPFILFHALAVNAEKQLLDVNYF